MMNTSFQSPKTLLLSHLQETWVSVIFTILVLQAQRQWLLGILLLQHMYIEETVQEVKALTTVQKVLDNKDTPEYISMDEFLLKTNLPHDICT